MKTIAKLSALLSFGFCMAGGLWLLRKAGDNDILEAAIGLYFVGKAFFLGPMLWCVARQMGK